MKQDYEWIVSCIGSCKNAWQLEVAKDMIGLFAVKYHANNREADDLHYLADHKLQTFGQ